MASNKLLGVVDVECGEDIYVFKADFNFLAKLNESTDDPMKIYVDLSNGSNNPEIIRNIMIASVKTKNETPVKKAKDEIENLITRYGLQECWLLCRHLLAYSMIGDEKKLELSSIEPNLISKMITEPFLLESSRNRQLLWAYHLLISGICACINFSLYIMLTV